MNKILKSFALLVCSICLSEIATAQINGVNIGDSVRVKSISHNKITGIVTSITSTMIGVSERDTQYNSVEIPIEDIETLELQREVKNTGRGALIGAGIGGVMLGVIVMASNESCGADEWCVMEFSDGEAFLMGTVVGLLPGALVGAVVGSNIKTKKWKEVSFKLRPEPISLSHVNKPPAPGITLKWSF